MKIRSMILLIDDEEVITFGFSRVLQEPGIAVDCAQSADAALALIATRQYDAAIVDLRLSNSIEMEGLDLIRSLRSNQKDCKIIVVTAYGNDEVKKAAKRRGCDLFFEKPIDPEIIKDALKNFGIYGFAA